MRLSHKTKIRVSHSSSNTIGHMCYAAYKLWNVCNYERHHYKELDLPVDYPDWYYQKKAHKKDLWYKQLPSQTAQEVCKQLDKSWKSFYKLKKTGGIENPKPPRYKHDNMVITYMHNGMTHDLENGRIRLSLPKKLVAFMSETYGINETYLILENEIFRNIENIKQIKIYPPENNECEVIVIYESKMPEQLCNNGKYLSVDLGVHNFMTCFNSDNYESFIVGRKYLSVYRYYSKEIASKQSQWAKTQSRRGIEYPKMSKHVKKLYEDKNNAINDYLHKMTRYVVNYCVENDINTVVIGDITGIREGKDYKDKVNQKLHSLPYRKIYTMLEYKLKKEGISFHMQKEAYTSQVSPLSDCVSKENAHPENRKKRGLYVDKDHIFNADCVGAVNILRLYLQNNDEDKKIKIDAARIKHPYVAKVAV